MILDTLKGRLIVSCQAYPGEPLDSIAAMVAMAQSAAIGGAAAIRARGAAHIRAIRRAVDIPLIGLTKAAAGDVYITPTLEDALEVAAAGAHIVATDGTRRARPDGRTLREVIAVLHDEAGVLVMADAGSRADALAAQESGADIVATTLAGYTDERAPTEGPDLALLAALSRELAVPVFAEGRIRTPAQARQAIESGAHAVVVGSAITHPARITATFVSSLEATRTTSSRNSLG